MDLRSLRRRVAILAARVPHVADVANIAIAIFDALPGGELVRLPDFERSSVFCAPSLEPGQRSIRIARKGGYPMTRRKLRAINVVFVDANTASSTGRSIAPANRYKATVT